MNEIRVVELKYCLDVNTLRKLRRYLGVKSLEKFSNNDIQQALRLLQLEDEYNKGFLTIEEHSMLSVRPMQILLEGALQNA